MTRRWWRQSGSVANTDSESTALLVTDGGEDVEGDADSDDQQTTDSDETDSESSPEPDRSNVEVTETGEADPADPKWEKPDIDDIPEFETGANEPLARSSGEAAADQARDIEQQEAEGPTSGMPNTARSPGDSRINREGTEGYIAALELCARLPEDIRLPEEAADLVPAAVEAELEQDVQSFAAAEFDNPSPHVDILEFVERDDELWLRLRLGIPTEAFGDLDPEEIRAHALQELEGIL